MRYSEMSHQEVLKTMFEATAEAKNFPQFRPLIAHYTSIHVLESIAKHNEIWMSHPLQMNDTQELIEGLRVARHAFLECRNLKNALAEKWWPYFEAYKKIESDFLTTHAYDTYIFCFTEHDANDTDGALSMWRGYGGDGSGIAIVVNTGLLVEPTQPTPFVFSKIAYRSAIERKAVLDEAAEIAAKWVTGSAGKLVGAENLGRSFFRIALLAALFTKHNGFGEEREWRLVYLAEDDTNGRRYHYHLGPRGPEPKLKVKIASDSLLSQAELSLDKIVDRILLGPTAASSLSQFAVRRMLREYDASRPLEQRVIASSTPFRAQ